MLTRIGTGELVVILLVALFVVGPARLPKLGKAVGKAIAGFKKYMNDVTEELKESGDDFKDIVDEMEKVRKDVSKTVREAGHDVENTVIETDKAVKDSISPIKNDQATL